MPKPKPLLRGQSLPIFNLTGDKTAEIAKQRRFVSESTSTLRMSGTSVEYSKQEITDKPIGQNGVFRQYLRGRPITMFAPSDSAEQGAKKESTLPTEMLRAEWVYGYRGRDCADNLHELASGEIVYNIASVVVLYDPRAGTQRHYLGHNSSIQCLAVHPAGVLVTSGQVMGVNRREQIAVYEKFDGFYETPDPNWYKPHVRVWDSKTLQTLAVIGGGKLQFGVCAVSFSVSDGGGRVLVVDDSPGKILTVWDWKNGDLLCEAVATRDLLETAAFHPMDSDMMVTAGKNHLGFWTIKKITAGSTSKAFLTTKKGLFAEHQAKFVHCLDFGDNGDVITGDSKGSILVWKKGCNRISHANPAAHKGGIMALRVTSEGTMVTGGGKDRRVVVWDRSYTRPLRECKLDKSLGGVRSICPADKCQMFSGSGLFLGTLSNALCHWTLDLEKVEAVAEGHADELWGLAAHPRKPQFVTCDYSGLVVLWESKTHRPIWRTNLKFAAQSAQFHPSEEILLIGTSVGRWYCMDASTAAVIEDHQAGEDNKQLDCLRFSPDGAILAVGSHDNHIYLYTVENHGKSYKKSTRLSGHSSFVTHLDFSTDGRYMQSTSGDYELLYWDVAARSQLQFKSAMRDVTWNTQTCVFGFHVFGMWQQGADGHDILSCALGRLLFFVYSFVYLFVCLFVCLFTRRVCSGSTCSACGSRGRTDTTSCPARRQAPGHCWPQQTRMTVVFVYLFVCVFTRRVCSGSTCSACGSRGRTDTTSCPARCQDPAHCWPQQTHTARSTSSDSPAASFRLLGTYIRDMAVT
ncbi:EML1 [Branchiostoma lanceolatum]|uniref:EML1 protein n=1 Tax=Branchiostoma lanceolatum TaxID=7740 RepID=A0A8K0EJC9_BRALA|nr:EML1 [Branchiostoma lanceolatum]